MQHGDDTGAPCLAPSPAIYGGDTASTPISQLPRMHPVRASLRIRCARAGARRAVLARAAASQAIVLTFALTACSQPRDATPDTRAAAPAAATTTTSTNAPPSLDGVWRTDGYGLLTDIRGDTLRRYEVTAVSCIQAGTATRRNVRGDTIRFASAAVNSDLGGAEDAFDITPGPQANARWIAVDGAISRIGMLRSDSLPSRCATPPAADAPSTYAVFWQTWREHYPFFAMHATDWSAVDQRVRPTITSRTSATSLLRSLRGMIEPLHDAHTFIDASTIKTGFGGGRVLPTGYLREQDALVKRMIESTYLQAPLRPMLNGQLFVGRLADGVPYLRLMSFAEYAKQPQFAVQLDSLETALDSIFRDAEAWRGLVIDVRRNGGGSDVFGTVIASRLTDRAYLAYKKVTRNDTVKADARTAPQPAMVVPSSRKRFLGPVMLLTGIESVSAAETFAMALMGRQPAVTRIGEHTQGVFSDVLVRRLPNGWMFGLPNEIYLTADGRSFDGPGVAPDMEVPVFRAVDVKASRDPAIERALERLGVRRDSIAARAASVSPAGAQR
jgi:Peptidase family S41